MSLKNVVSAQYKAIVDEAAAVTGALRTPPEGWIRTVRKALGMSMVQLAAKLKVTRAFISKTENGELNETVTLKTMHKIAQAMGCRFVYAIVPEHKIDELILQQAKLKAKYIVSKTNIHMALEDQLLPEDKIQFEIDRLTQEIIKENHPDLWGTDWGSKK